MPTKGRTLKRRSLWIISSYQNNRMETLTISPELDGGFLAAFSYEKEAEAFLWLLGDGEKKKGWQSKKTTAKGLVSVLLERCGGRERCDSTLATGT
jgi:hypothetical protein